MADFTVSAVTPNLTFCPGKRRSEGDTTLKFPEAASLETCSLTSFSFDMCQVCTSTFFLLPLPSSSSLQQIYLQVSYSSVAQSHTSSDWHRFDTHSTLTAPNDVQRNITRRSSVLRSFNKVIFMCSQIKDSSEHTNLTSFLRN